MRVVVFVLGIATLLDALCPPLPAFGMGGPPPGPSTYSLARLTAQLMHRNVSVRRAAADELWRRGPAANEARPALLTGLGDKDARVRQSCARALGTTGPAGEVVFRVLERAWSDPDPLVRAYAAASLIKLKSTDSDKYLAFLIDGLQSDDNPSRTSAALALIEAGPLAKSAVPALLKALDDPLMRYPSMKALQSISPGRVPEAMPILLKMLHDPDRDVRHTAAATLAKVAPTENETLPALLKALQDPDGFVRYKVVFALQELGPAAKAAVPNLIEALSDSDRNVRRQVAEALGIFGPDAQSAVPALVAALRDQDIRVWIAAVDSLQKIGAGALLVLIEALGEADPGARRAASMALAKFGCIAGQAVSPLLTLLRDSEPGMRQAAAIALSEIGQKAANDATPLFVELLTDPNEEVRASAARGLVKFGKPPKDAIRILLRTQHSVNLNLVYWNLNSIARVLQEIEAEGLPAVIDLLHDPDKSIRNSAGELLGSIGALAPAQVGAAILKAMKDPSVRFWGVPELSVLVRKHSDLIPLIIAVLKDPNAEIRDGMAAVLGEVGNIDAKGAAVALIEALNDEQPPESARASLARLGASSEEVVPLLVNAIQNPDSGVRLASVWILGEIGAAVAENDGERTIHTESAMASDEVGRSGEAIVPALLLALQDDGEDVRDEARRALHKVGPDATEVIPILIADLKDKFSPVRRAAAGVLEDLGRKAEPAIPALLVALRDGKPSVRESAVQALARVGPQSNKVALALVDALGDESVRSAATQTLFGSDSNEIIPALVDKLSSRDPQVRWAAHLVLIQISSKLPKVLPALEASLASPSANAREMAAQALGGISKTTERERIEIWQLVEDINDPAGRGRGDAFQVLWEFNGNWRDSVGAIGRRLEDSNEHVRGEAVKALGRLGFLAVDTLPALIKATHDNDREVAILATDALGEIGRARKELVVPALIEVLDRDDPPFTDAAALALAKVDPTRAKAAVPVLIEILEERGSRDFAADDFTAVARALGGIGPDAQQAVPALLDTWKRSAIYSHHTVAGNAIKKIDPEAAKAAGIK